jgi:hypothetical protein
LAGARISSNAVELAGRTVLTKRHHVVVMQRLFFVV